MRECFHSRRADEVALSEENNKQSDVGSQPVQKEHLDLDSNRILITITGTRECSTIIRALKNLFIDL